jgi:hypothetical protein
MGSPGQAATNIDICSDHYMLQSKFKIHKQYYAKKMNKKLIKSNKMLKTHLLTSRKHSNSIWK